LVGLCLSQNSFVYAQELATASASPEEATVSADVPFDAIITPEVSAASASAPIDISGDIESSISALPAASDSTDNMVLGPSGVQNPSATIKQPFHVRDLRKHSFRANERVTVVVDNAWENDVTVELFDVDGVKQNVTLKTISDGDPLVLEVLPNAQFRSGRYRLVVTDAKGNVTPQDFTWGVLAINTNKSIYMPQESAKLAIAILDETGMMECHADVTLTIKHEGNTDVLSTADGSIHANDVCEQKIFTLIPDYEAIYKTGSVGTYDMQLTAKTDNGTFTITDAFEVRETVPFDVERTTATRIFPPATYPVTFAITFHEDFEGTIQETVPGNFAVWQQEGEQFTIERQTITQDQSDVLGASVVGIVQPFDNKHPVSLGFGQQLRDPVLQTKYSDFGLLGHDGIDFDMPIGTAVLSVDDGVVTKIDLDGDYGTTLVISHSWGKSYYGHLSLITAQLGHKVKKGHPVALSGNSGLSTGPHLHFGIKLNVNDEQNGYFGKTNPWDLLSHAQEIPTILAEEKTMTEATESGQTTPDSIEQASMSASMLDEATSAAVLGTSSVGDMRKELKGPGDERQILTWKITAKKGETKQIGYQFQAPNISPQFFHLGPLTFRDGSNVAIFSEGRSWQLAIDADGSGTNTVSPTTGTVSATSQTYTFTFTASESMNSGEFTITVPSGWSAPQGTGGTAGYTTVGTTGTAIVGTVLVSGDGTTYGNWTLTEDDGDACNTVNPALDTTTKIEGSGSIKCDNSGSSATDATDSFSFDNSGTVNWSSYTTIGFWIRSSKALTSTNGIAFAYDDTAAMSSLLQSYNTGTVAANTWSYFSFSLSATRTAVKAFGLVAVGSGFDSASQWLDEVLIGPGVPTFSGTGPWTISTRILKAASTDTFSVVYGDAAGGAGSTVTNASTAGVYTFTTQSKTGVAGTLTDISSSPTITLSASLDTLLRHGAYFSGGIEQPFTF